MNIQTSSKTVLCYGDSNTWGQTPDGIANRRPAEVRWTGVLQGMLGRKYDVIEEGLSGRTTNLDYAGEVGGNGMTYLQPCLDSHAPLDVVVLMLGTNDFKIEFNRSTQEIAQAIEELVVLILKKTAQYNGRSAQVVLVSPIYIDADAPMLKERYAKNYDDESAQKSRNLAGYLNKIAQVHGCSFVDAAKIAKAGTDGVHFDEASHQALGELLANRVKDIDA